MTFRARLGRIAGAIDQNDPERWRNALYRRLKRFGLGWLALPLFVVRVASILLACILQFAAKIIDALCLLLWKFNIDRNGLLPLYIEIVFLASGRSEEAVGYCEEFLARNPAARSALLVLIDLKLAIDQTQNAVALMRSIAMTSTNPEELYRVGRKIVDFFAAADIAQTTRVLGVQEPVLALIDLLQADASFDSIALQCFDKAIADTYPGDPTHRKARYWRGVLHFHCNEFDLAELDFRAVTESGVEYVFAYVFLSDIRQRRGDLREAIRLLMLADQQNQRALPVLERLCKLMVLTGDVGGALEVARRLLHEDIAHIVADVR